MTRGFRITVVSKQAAASHFKRCNIPVVIHCERCNIPVVFQGCQITDKLPLNKHVFDFSDVIFNFHFHKGLFILMVWIG